VVAWPARRSPALGYNSIMCDKQDSRSSWVGWCDPRINSISEVRSADTRVNGPGSYELINSRLLGQIHSCQDCETAALPIAAEAVVTIGYVCPPLGLLSYQQSKVQILLSS
jgi:hypothetical protein